ncbi:MAG: hypothetical protein PHW04_17710 [Candidatus Wallbacteria bacterium]|nr:hypothetical protein [Candidatus Wallbacteria bacterium]
MKKTCALMFLFLLLGGLYAEQKITLNERNSLLTDVIKKIGLTVVGLEKIYPDENSMPRLTALIQNLPDNRALEAVCSSLNLELLKSGEVYLAQRRQHAGTSVFDDGYQVDMQQKDSFTGEVSIGIDREIPMLSNEMDNQMFYREFNQLITITKAIPAEKRIEFLFNGKPQSIREGENFNDRIQLLQVVSAREILIYYPQMFIRLTVKVQNGTAKEKAKETPKMKTPKAKTQKLKITNTTPAGGNK